MYDVKNYNSDRGGCYRSSWITIIFSCYVTLRSNGLMRYIFFMFKTLDNWTFDPFRFNDITGGHPLRYLCHELFIRYDLMAKFKVSNEIYNKKRSSLYYFLFSKVSQPFQSVISCANSLKHKQGKRHDCLATSFQDTSLVN